MEAEVIDNPAQSRFELPLGDSVAAAYYRIENGRVMLVHTEVPQDPAAESDRGWRAASSR